jgi:hypothetical protein
MMMLVNNLCINKIFIHLEIFESIQITKPYRESKKVEAELYLIEWYCAAVFIKDNVNSTALPVTT